MIRGLAGNEMLKNEVKQKCVDMKIVVLSVVLRYCLTFFGLFIIFDEFRMDLNILIRNIKFPI